MSFWPIVALLLVSALWGSHPVVGKLVETQSDPLSLTIWRFTLGAVFYLPLLGRLRAILKLPRRRLWQLGLATVCWSVLYPLLYYRSLQSLTPVESLLLVNTSPFLAALLAWLTLGERLGARAWIGMGVSFAGVGVLLAGQIHGTISWSGSITAILAAAAFAGYTVSSRSLYSSLPLLDVLLVTSTLGAAMLWLGTAVTGHVHQVMTGLTDLSGAGWAQLLYIVVIVSTVAYVLYGYGLKRLPAGISSAATFYPQVLFAALIQWVWLGVIPSLLTGISAVMIFSGTALMRGDKPQRRPDSNVPEVHAHQGSVTDPGR